MFESTTESGDLFPHLTEHMYKECLHNLRPKWKLFKSFKQAQEEVERLRQQLYPNFGEADDGKTLGTINENESEDYTSEAWIESDDQLKPRSENEDFQDDYTEEEKNSQLDDQKSQEQKEQEKSEQDLVFEAMFEKMATDSYQERIRESSKVSTVDIPVPMTTRAAKKTYEQLQDTEVKQSDAVPFVLMVRSAKSGKHQFKNFVAPCNSELAVNLKLQEQKIKEENERVKRLTLNITERLEEEDYNESLQKPAFSKRPKYKPYKHQFGVPDTENIFH